MPGATGDPVVLAIRADFRACAAVVPGRFDGTDFAWVWGWFLPTLMPTLSLIIGVLIADALRSPRRNRQVRPFLYRLALGLSCAYLGLVLLTFIAQPYTALPPHELLEKSQAVACPCPGFGHGKPRRVLRQRGRYRGEWFGPLTEAATVAQAPGRRLRRFRRQNRSEKRNQFSRSRAAAPRISGSRATSGSGSAAPAG